MLTDRAKKLLADLDECLVEEKLSGATSLWYVLTALRGPDNLDGFYISENDRYHVKPSTTGVIRRKLFPKASDAGITGVTREDTDNATHIRRKIGTAGHFLSHARDAFEALDLRWDEWNKD